MYEFSGGDTTGFYDNAENGASSTGDNPSISLTTNTNGACIVGQVSNGTLNLTVGGGYTDVPVGNQLWYEDASYLENVGSAGPKTYSWTEEDEGQPTYLINAAAFKPADTGTTIIVPTGPVR
jgi:hypothetical protein